MPSVGEDAGKQSLLCISHCKIYQDNLFGGNLWCVQEHIEVYDGLSVCRQDRVRLGTQALEPDCQGSDNTSATS